MHHPFAPLIVFALCPLLYAGASFSLLRHRWWRFAVLAVTVAIAAVGCWAGGVDFAQLNRMKMFLAGAVALVVAHRTGTRRADAAAGGAAWDPSTPGTASGSSSPAPPGTEVPRYISGKPAEAGGGREKFVLTLLVILALAVHFNFLSFHGTGATRVYVHLHDVAHYYLGSKYFSELGYGDLYTAMLRAEAEKYDNHFRAIEVRDLRSNALVHIRALLQQSEAVKVRFAPGRWEDFKRDVAWFRGALGPQYGEILKDHGFNPTPVWALLGGPIANLVPAGGGKGILVLTLLDLLVLGAMFAAVAWAFGTHALLLSLIYFCLPFGCSFGWTGGGFLRFVWLACVVVAAGCLERRHHAWAGGLIGLATMLRVFPAAFALAVGLGAAVRLWRKRRLDGAHLRFGVAFAAVAGFLLAASLLRNDGFLHWQEFRTNMQHHLQSNAFNTIGLNEIVAYGGPAKPDTPEAFAAETDRRSSLYRLQLAIAFPLAVLAVLAVSRRYDDTRTAAMATLLLFSGLTLASYYWIFLLLFVVLRSDDGRSLAFLFGAEALMYALALFEDREVVLYFYKNLAVGGLLIALHAEPLRAAASRSAAQAG